MRESRERTIRCGYELAKFCRFAGNINTLTAAPSEALRNAHTDIRMQKPDFEFYLICLHVGALGRIQNPIPATSLRDFRMRHHRYTINQLRKVGGWVGRAYTELLMCAKSTRWNDYAMC